MALTDKNIVITPNIGAALDPKMVFSGADASTAAQNITLTVYPTNGGTLSFDGSTGQLFSVTNSMSGTIFSANDVSGIPSIEVLDTGLVKIAQYSGNLLLGSGTDTGLAKLQVTGSLSLTGNALHSPTSRSIYGPNPTWSSYLYVGGDGVNGITRTGSIASIAATNGNMHIDSGSDKAMYFNFYSGTGGFNFGNGTSSGIPATISGAGVFNGTNVTVNGNQTLHAGNYTSYSPTLTGGSASGTWGISVTGSSASTTGNAATVTNATFVRQFTVRDDRSDGSDYSLANRPTGLYAITAQGTNGTGAYYSSLIHVANGSDVAFQIAGGYNADNMYFRGTTALQNGTGYSAWRTVLHSGNYTSYSPSLTGGSASGTWGISVTGSAATVTTAAQTNITSLGTLTALNVSGGITLSSAANNSITTTGTGSIIISTVTQSSGSTAGVSILSGNCTWGSGTAGPVGLVPGSTTGSTGAAVTIRGGAALGASALGGPVTITGGFCGTTSTTTGTGGAVYVYGGYSQAVSGTHIGGSTYIDGGKPNAGGTVTNGQVYIGTTPAGASSAGTLAITIGKSTVTTTTINATVKLPDVGTSGFVKLGAGGQLSADTTVITSANYTSYSPTLTGGSASGTWGINITGNAVTASHSFGRTDATAYPVMWGTATSTTQLYSCTAVNIQSSTGTLNVTTLYASANVTAYSDERVKTNWRGFSNVFVKDLAKVKSGIYDRTDCELTQVGVSAQSLQSVLPNAVIEDEEGKLSVVYGHAALVSAVELAKEVVSLNARIARLEALVSKLIEG